MQRTDAERLIPKITRAERVWLQLASEIVNGGVPGGRRLDEVEQAQRLGVSRTPLRESLRQLAALGLVENRPHRGVVVAAEAGDSLFAVLAELEAAGARQAAEMLTPSERDRLRESASKESLVVTLIRRGSGNAVLRGLLDTLWQPISTGLSDNECTGAAAAAARMALAVAGGHGDAAAAAARHYVKTWRDFILGALDHPTPNAAQDGLSRP